VCGVLWSIEIEELLDLQAGALRV